MLLNAVQPNASMREALARDGKDPELIKFVFENKKYDLEQTVAIVKRIKAWQKG